MQTKDFINSEDLLQKNYLDCVSKIESPLFHKMDMRKILWNETYYCQLDYNCLFLFLKVIFFKNADIFKSIYNNDLLCLYSKNYRIDHDEYWDKIKSCCPKHDEITIYKSKSLDLLSVPDKLCWYNHFYKKLISINNRKHRRYLALKLVERAWVLSRFIKMDLCPQVVMCYFDSSPDENVLMQYYKLNGSITITNQHGLCIFRSRDYDRVNQSEILNFKCDYFFARSEKQKEQFIAAGYNPDRIRIVGLIDNTNHNIPEICKNVVGIYLDSPSLPFAIENNKKMIQIGKEIYIKTGMSYLVKCHPHDNVDNYSNVIDEKCVGVFGKNTKLVDTFNEVDICITHASATYVDVYSYGLRCLKMNSELPFPIAMNEDEFTTSDEAVSIINEWKMLDKIEKNKYIEYVRNQYASTWSDENIKKEIEKILGRRILK